MSRSRGYYRFRSIVRWVFWLGLLMVSEFLFIRFLDAFWRFYGLEGVN